MIRSVLMGLALLLAGAPLPAAASERSAWLAKHGLPWAADRATTPLLLPAQLRDARVILLGEIHGLAHGQVVDLAMIKALHRQAGVRLYLGEFDAAQADAFNEFLASGDDRLLDSVFDNWRVRGLQWANVDFRDKLLAIQRWNAALPRSQRVRFLGADEVQDRDAYCRWLSRRLERPAIRSEVRRLAEALRDPARCASASALAAAAVARTRGLDRITVDGIAALVADAATADREARIEANIRRYLSVHRGRFYGMWGLYHVVQAEVNGTAPMALRLLRAGVSVRSVAILNLAGEMMIPIANPNGGIMFATMAYTVDSADAALVNGIEPFATAARGPLTLFPLSGRASPFRHSDALTRVGGRLGQMQPFAIDPSTAPRGFWVDAIWISRGSSATQPLPESRVPLAR